MYIYIYIFMYACIYMYVYIYTYIHTYIYIHITLHHITFALHYITLHLLTFNYITLHYLHTYVYCYIRIYIYMLCRYPIMYVVNPHQIPMKSPIISLHRIRYEPFVPSTWSKSPRKGLITLIFFGSNMETPI